jgi:hypothetical protein
MYCIRCPDILYPFVSMVLLMTYLVTPVQLKTKMAAPFSDVTLIECPNMACRKDDTSNAVTSVQL